MKRIYIKKLCCAISAAALGLSISACSKGGLFAQPTPTPLPKADASSVLTIENAAEAVNGKYTIELEGGAAVNEGNTSTASYYADPKGDGDPIIVKVTYPDASKSYEQIWNDYENARVARESAEFAEGIGEDAYIAFPSIHVFNRGCEIVITAGSGADKDQTQLLKNLALKAVENLNAVMPEISTDFNNL